MDLTHLLGSVDEGTKHARQEFAKPCRRGALSVAASLEPADRPKQKIAHLESEQFTSTCNMDSHFLSTFSLTDLFQSHILEVSFWHPR